MTGVYILKFGLNLVKFSFLGASHPTPTLMGVKFGMEVDSFAPNFKNRCSVSPPWG